MMENSLLKSRNITYDRFVFFSFNQPKGQSVESIYGRLIGQAENCSLGNEETTLIRDTFIPDMRQYRKTKRQYRKTKFLNLQCTWKWGRKINRKKSKFEF